VSQYLESCHQARLSRLPLVIAQALHLRFALPTD
jgi:hypothetical protein